MGRTVVGFAWYAYRGPDPAAPGRVAPPTMGHPREMLDEGQFRTEGGRFLLVRLLSTRRTARGEVQECEFEVRDPEAARGQGGPR